MSRKPSVAAQPTTTLNAEPLVKIDSEVTRRIRQHARAHIKTEVCGVLIGESTDDAIDIHASIEALNAAQAGTHVTFTQDAWEEIYKVKDEQYPDARIVGWYHSHPGFGIFLSDHDLFIQENFFSSPGQVAWVYDPHSDDEGCFGWIAGKVARLTSVATLYQSGEPVEHAANTHGAKDYGPTADSSDEEEKAPVRSSARQTSPAWLRWAQTTVTHLLVLMAGFAIAYYLLPRYLAILPDQARGQIMVVDYNQLRSFFKGNGPMPKAVDVISLPVSDPAAAAVPSTTGPAPAAAPSATQVPQPTAPAATQPAKPKAEK